MQSTHLQLKSNVHDYREEFYIYEFILCLEYRDAFQNFHDYS